MAIRTALRQSALLTFVLIAAFLWIGLAWLGVFGALDVANPGTVGHGAFSGVVGLLVMLVALGLLVVLFSEVAETEPGPEAWPPSDSSE